MRGVVACEGLYPLVERFAPDAEVRYLPAELHEFPVNVPLEETIVGRVRTAVEDLDEPSRDTIVVSYAIPDADRAALSTTHADLVLAEDADCVATVLSDPVGEYGERRAAGTLYLTRGWIDCGVDSYKLARAYRGDVDELVSEFQVAAAEHPDMRVTWHRGERFQRAVNRPQVAPEGPLAEFFGSITRHFERVALVDTGDCYAFHHEYADRVRAFVDRHRQAAGADGAVELAVVDGETARLRDLLLGDRSA